MDSMAKAEWSDEDSIVRKETTQNSKGESLPTADGSEDQITEVNYDTLSCSSMGSERQENVPSEDNPLNFQLDDLPVYLRNGVSGKKQSSEKSTLTDKEVCVDSFDEHTTGGVLTHLTESTVLGTDAATTIVSPEKRKPFLGGFRNKITGVEYHNAASQTAPPRSKYKAVERFCRDSQTTDLKNQWQQTDRDAWTQVETEGIYLPCHTDRAVASSNSYISAVEIIASEISAALVLQKCCRRWLAKRELRRLQQEQESRRRWEEEQEYYRKLEEEEWVQQQFDRRVNPFTEADFKLLFSDLKKWWQKEVASAEETKSGAQLKATLCDITDREVEYIKNINSKRLEASKLNREQNRQYCLDKAASPKKWQGWKTYENEVTVETPGTANAHTLRNLYYTLSMGNLSREEVINALLTLKDIIKDQDCSLTSELASLCNRAIELYLRDTNEKYLVGLRNRIRTLFWQYTRQPAFNPEVLRQLKAEIDPGVLGKSTFACLGCGQYYLQDPYIQDSTKTSNIYTNRLMKCKTCRYLENEGWARKENEAYKRMLKLLKQQDIEDCSTSGLVFLLQISDISYIVEKIWNRESALSGSDDLKELELSRWDRNRDWTPWNCILLTRQETLVHKSLENPDQVYNIEFVQAVHLKHVAARTYFSSIPRLLPYLNSSMVDDTTSE